MEQTKEFLNIKDDIELRLLSLEHKDDLLALININRDHLREWLPWLDSTTSLAHIESFLHTVVSQHESGRGPHYAIYYHSTLGGVCGFHPIDRTNNVGAIAYWLAKELAGKGIATRSVQALMEIGFRNYALNRIEIACATENHKSRAIPERLGFKQEDILRQREYLYGNYVDHAVYSLLVSDYDTGFAHQR